MSGKIRVGGEEDRVGSNALLKGDHGQMPVFSIKVDGTMIKKVVGVFVIACFSLSFCSSCGCSSRSDKRPTMKIEYKSEDKTVFSNQLPNSSAINGWDWQNPLPNGTQINDIDIVGGWIFWAVGDAGLVLKSWGGKKWDRQNSNTNEKLLSISVVDSNKAWAVGEHSIIHTSDGGNTWTPIVIGESGGFFEGPALSASDTAVWVAHGGRIWRSVDEGRSWTYHDFFVSPYEGQYFRSLSAVNSKVAWAVGATIGSSPMPIILRTIDGGRTWKFINSDIHDSFVAVSALSEKEAWIASGTTIMHTKNGGMSWAKTTFPSAKPARDRSGGLGLTDLFAVNQTTALAIRCSSGRTEYHFGEENKIKVQILVLEDAGNKITRNWINTSGIEFWRRAAVAGISAREIWLAGAWISSTDNGGISWHSDFVNVACTDLKDTSFVDSKTAWAVGFDGCILKTEDGNNWTRQTSGTTSTLQSVSATSDKVAWVTGEDFIARTIDGGKTWIPISQPEATDDPQRGIRNVSAVDANTAWVAGNAVVGKTTDGGVSWTRYKLSKFHEYFSPLCSVSAVNEDVAWVTGINLQAYRTTDGGTTWTSVKVPTMPWYSDDESLITTVHALSRNIAVVGASWEHVAVTTDGGQNWTEIPKERLSVADMSLRDLIGKPLDNHTGHVSFEGDVGGMHFNTINIAADGTGWAVGPHGTIMKR